MSSTFAGFSEEDLKRIKSCDSGSTSVPEIDTAHIRKLDKIGARPKRVINQYKLSIQQQQDTDDNIDSLFEKCKLSIKTPTSPPKDGTNNNYDIHDDSNSNDVTDTSDYDENEDPFASIDVNRNSTLQEENKENNNTQEDNREYNITIEVNKESNNPQEDIKENNAQDENSEDNKTREENKESSNAQEENIRNSKILEESRKNSTATVGSRKSSSSTTPDIVRCVDNYTEDDLAAHRAKLADLQLKQKIMEEQNKKRKEMLAKALADRTKQTSEEVMRLEKIKKELQVLDGQFSMDVSVLRKKIDQACLSYADAEKHYLKVEKEFLQAKINLQKEKEKKELLTEHLCALITHNETRKAHKLENLMLELATDKKIEINNALGVDDEDRAVIVDGVDERTGKIVEFTKS